MGREIVPFLVVIDLHTCTSTRISRAYVSVLWFSSETAAVTNQLLQNGLQFLSVLHGCGLFCTGLNFSEDIIEHKLHKVGLTGVVDSLFDNVL